MSVLEGNEDRDVLRGLANAVIGWKHRHAHDAEGFREVDQWLRRADNVLRKAGYYGNAAQRAMEEEDATSGDI
jgi:hypothetical protein